MTDEAATSASKGWTFKLVHLFSLTVGAAFSFAVMRHATEQSVAACIGGSLGIGLLAAAISRRVKTSLVGAGLGAAGVMLAYGFAFWPAEELLLGAALGAVAAIAIWPNEATIEDWRMRVWVSGLAVMFLGMYGGVCSSYGSTSWAECSRCRAHISQEFWFEVERETLYPSPLTEWVEKSTDKHVHHWCWYDEKRHSLLGRLGIDLGEGRPTFLVSVEDQLTFMQTAPPGQQRQFFRFAESTDPLDNLAGAMLVQRYLANRRWHRLPTGDRPHYRQARGASG